MTSALSRYIASFFGRASFIARLLYWKTPRRYKKNITVTMNPYKGDTIRGQVFDISESGAFVAVDDGTKTILEDGDRINLSICLNTLRQIRCEATVARRVSCPNTHPCGYGIQFENLEAGEKKRLKRFLRSA